MTKFGDRLYQLGGTPVGGDLIGLLGTGRVRYLDPNRGDDGASGKTPERAWKTLQYSVDNLGYRRANGDADGRQDILIRMPGVEEVTAEIAIDGGYGKAGTDFGANIAIVAATAGQRVFGDVLGCHTRAGSGYTTGNLIGVYYRAISFYGLSFGNRGTGSQSDGSDACIAYRTDSSDAGKQTAGGGQFGMVRNCNFRDDGGLNTNGIYYFGSGGHLAYQNTFGYYDATRGPIGIMVRGSSTNNPFDIAIRDNIFSHCPIGIQWGAATIPGGILCADNYFTGNTVAIQFDNGFTCTGRGLEVNNRFDTAEDATATHTNGTGSGDDTAQITTDTNVEFSGNWFTNDVKPVG